MLIDITNLTKLVDGELTLTEYVRRTSLPIDDAILQGASTALSTLSKNKDLLNNVLNWLNLPVSFASVGNPNNATLSAAQSVPEDLQSVPGLNDLKSVLLDCKHYASQD